MVDTFTALSPEQKAAVTCLDNSLVIAGPGSGKTAVLAWKVGYLLRHVVKPPFRVAAITFTNEAAEEIRKRVSEIATEDVDRAYFGSIHSFCLNVLVRPYARHLGIGLDRELEILDSTLDAARTVVANEGLQISEWEFLGRVRSLKSQLKYPDPANAYPAESPEALCLLYQKHLAKFNLVDFDDIIWYAHRILTTIPVARSVVQAAYPWVIVDEYQDTDLAQHQVLQALKGNANRFFAVGDPDQSIYRFRHTDPKNIERFAVDFSAKIYELAVNYRSPQAIAEAAARLISRNATDQKEAVRVTSGATGSRIFLRASNTSAEEAQFVVGTLWPYFSKNGVKPPDFAVLARTKDALGEVIAELQKAKVKYRFVEDLPYVETVETRIIAGAIRYWARPQDMNSLRDATDAMGLHYPDVRSDFSSDKSVVERNTKLIRMVDEARKKGAGPGHLASQMSDTFKIADRILKTENSSRERERRYKQVDAIGKWIETCHTNARNDSEKFLQEFELSDSIRLMSLHRAKGLEFPVVCMIALEEGVIPSWQSVRTNDPDEMAEERRVMYVGVTRAREYLVLSHAKQRYVQRQQRYFQREPSRFIAEIPGTLVQSI